MKKFFYLFSALAIVYMFLTFKLANAHELNDDPLGKNSCSPWVKEKNLKCIFNRKSTAIWRRTCYDETRLCHPYRFEPCDAEEICTEQNPNQMTEVCTEWSRLDNMKCHSRRTDTWEQSWVRSCVLHRVKTQECSKVKP